MGIVYTGEELIRTIRRQGVIPRTGMSGSLDWDMLTVLSEIQESKLVPKIAKLREDFFLVKTRTPLVSGTVEYRIPPRAAFQKVAGIYIWDGSARSNPQTLQIQGNYIVVSEADSETGYQLEIHWYMRPSSIQLSANCRQVKAINPTAKTIQLTSVPPTAWTASETVDVHSQYSGAEIELWDEVVSILGDTLTFTNAIDGSTYGTRQPAIGDWVCLAGWAALPAIPAEYHPTLALMGAHRMLVAQGALKEAEQLAKDIDPEIRDLLGATDIREDRKPVKVSLRGSALFPNG